MTTPSAPAEVWFLTGSQGLYGEDVVRQVVAHSQSIAATLDGTDAIPATVVWKPVLTETDAIRRIALEANADDRCVGVVAWMHTFSPAKMWISGLDALRKPMLHLHTQANVELPWGEIDMDFMNLNQAAHGDREFGYIQTRIGLSRKTVAGHVSDPAVVDRIGTWVRAATASCADAHDAAGPLRRQHARRGRHRGRQGRGGAEVRRLGQRLRRQRPGGQASTRRWTATSTPW